jgi:RNA polymerase sigma-70 factor (ECF subfamily)
MQVMSHAGILGRAVRPEWKLTIVAAQRSLPAETAAPPVDERELVRACQAGEREAFDILVERHRRTVYQLCYRFVGNHEDASDLSQEVFLRAYRGLRNFKGGSSIATWLYRIGVNACLNRVSQKRPIVEPLEPERHVDASTPHPVDALLRDERAARVKAAIARLPDRQRATLVLRVYHELPHEEIARILGSSVGAVKANFFHALGHLRRLLAESEP